MVHLSGLSLLLCAIIVYKFGRFVTSKIHILNHYHIPAPVTGGLLASFFLFLCEYYLRFKIHWHFELRDQFLLIFFCTVGLSARIRLLISGGKTLALLFFVMAGFLILQNAVGVITALTINENPIYGLLAGSISMAGGHGTAISWGAFLEAEGYKSATEFGLMAATMGLIMGGLLGGPVAHALIKNHRLNAQEADLTHNNTPESIDTRQISLGMQETLKVILIICICVITGKWLNGYFRAADLVMPDYLPVLMLALILINALDTTKITFNDQLISLFSSICLEMFITMSLMSLNLMQLAETALPAFIIVAVQSFIICLFAYYLVFRASGKDYDASLITAGFIGSGLGATPVGLANVSTLTQRFGPSPKAFIVVPLLGSVFTDTLNAVILQLFLSLPFIHP